MYNAHESKLLNSYLGRKVKITFFDGSIIKGYLAMLCVSKENKRVIGYALTKVPRMTVLLIGDRGYLHFKKTHVENIEEIEGVLKC